MDVSSLIDMHPSFANATPAPIPNAMGLRAVCRCILYKTELRWRSYGESWLFLLSLLGPGATEATTPFSPVVLRTLRAGASDIGGRVPSVATLQSKRIAIFGLGAIGAPSAIELARNGCGELRMIEHDIVEPGNTVRWPIGASAWGYLKTEALVRFICREYPATTTVVYQHMVGGCPPPFLPPDFNRTDDVLKQALNGVDLVIDATAERGINWLLDDVCREHGVPLITAHATPTLEGGVVARFCYQGRCGCRMCLEHAWLKGDIPEPRGANAGDDALGYQAPGCAERTFPGASFDLTEIALQAVRLAVDTLTDSPMYPTGSCAQVLSFTDEKGKRIPPQWQSFPVKPHHECKNPHQ